ncbi:hypothetical protein HU200_051437 [Digitaria exilis]|uniref:Uncharacterized protein n=1 Tax=Digitaria exilis TaxID=1010633 RepID=A0A835AUQ4_9POAL|nr:hypothetical protein HU200_051437 [Digitaria exilis]CAB3454490.1 unnamed protein product [Digitaria exilis]
MPVTFSFSVCGAHQNPGSSVQHNQSAESQTARRELQLLEDHRPWEMLDHMALAIIDQTYTALLEILHRSPPPPSEEGDDDGHVVTLSQPLDASGPDSQVLLVEASARHCRIYVMSDVIFHAAGDMGREFTPQLQRRAWPPRHRLTRARIGASLGTLYLARIDGGGRGDYWRCADEVRPDVAGRGLLGVLDTIRSRLDAAARLEATLLAKARSLRCRGSKVREILRVWTALDDIRRAVDLDVIIRRRFQKRRRIMAISWRPEVETHVDQEDEAEEVTKRLKALRV